MFAADVSLGTVQVYWPEGNVLVDPALRSPLAKIPAYKDIVATVRRAGGAEAVLDGRTSEPVVRP